LLEGLKEQDKAEVDKDEGKDDEYDA